MPILRRVTPARALDPTLVAFVSGLKPRTSQRDFERNARKIVTRASSAEEAASQDCVWPIGVCELHGSVPFFRKIFVTRLALSVPTWENFDVKLRLWRLPFDGPGFWFVEREIGYNLMVNDTCIDDVRHPGVIVGSGQQILLWKTGWPDTNKHKIAGCSQSRLTTPAVRAG